MNKYIIKTLIAAACCSTLLWACVREDDGIPNDLNLPVISADDITVTETDADQIVQVTLRLTGDNPTNAIVNFVAIPDAEVGANDYVLLNTERIIFAPGETTKTIDIRIVADEVRENTESFQIQLYNLLNAKYDREFITVTINDDDDNAAGLVIPAAGYSTPTAYPGYSLVWADEFDGAVLDESAWNYEIGAGGWGNNELQYYRKENTSIVDGHLVITAREQKFGGSDYTSSRLTTKGKKQYKFGRVDIRAALPKGKGLWPALWMLGSNIDAVGWPSCGEIDIMELTGDLPNRVLGTVHYGPNVAGHQYKTAATYLSDGKDFNSEFHVFSLVWEADKIEILVDDVVFQTITPASLNGAAYPFNKNFFFIFNIAVGGNLPGSPDATTAFPQWMVVDYIRVFQ